MTLPDKHLVSRYKELRILLMYFMHRIIFATSELGLVAIAIEIMLTQIQLGGVKFVSYSGIILSELIFHSMYPPNVSIETNKVKEVPRASREKYFHRTSLTFSQYSLPTYFQMFLPLASVLSLRNPASVRSQYNSTA